MTETILQLGAGRFLRAFFDRFVQQSAEAGHDVGKIAVVQSTAGKRAELLDPAVGFHVWVRGVSEGETVDRLERVRSISRALVAGQHWDEVQKLARSPDLKLIVSNATEAGYALDETDTFEAAPPQSMPGKLTQLLRLRHAAGAAPLTLLPCELLENNADKLRELVLRQARLWNLPDDFLQWVAEDCVWLNNLVDCIVTLPPEPHPTVSDPALVQAEPYALLAIRGTTVPPVLPRHPAVRIVSDLQPYYLRKVRILNGLHTAMTALYLPAGMRTVKEVLADREAARKLRTLLFEEIVPTIAYRVEGAAEFADAVWDRLRNPFIDHKLADIALNHAAKIEVRLRTTRDEYERLFGKPPAILTEALARVLS